MSVFKSSDPKHFESPHWIGTPDTPDYLQDGLFSPSEIEPTPSGVLGFVPLDYEEQGLALRLQSASEQMVGGRRAGVAKYLSRIAGNKKGGRDRAVRAVVRKNMINPFKSSLNHLNILDGLDEDAELLGVTVFEDDRYEDMRRDIVASYFSARQRNNGIKPNEQTTLRDFMREAESEDIVRLVQETQTNLEKRASFWRAMLEQAGEFYPMVRTMVKSDNLEDLVYRRR